MAVSRRTQNVRTRIGFLMGAFFTWFLTTISKTEQELRNIQLLQEGVAFEAPVPQNVEARKEGRALTTKKQGNNIPVKQEPIQTQNNTMLTDMKGCSPMSELRGRRDDVSSQPSVVSNNVFIPIFVLSRDRVTSLRQVVQSYNRTLSSPHEIIILDHQSTYPPMLEYLRELKSSGVRVHALKEEDWTIMLDESADFIQQYLDARPDVEFYVFTDSDIALMRSSPDILLFFAGLLRSCRKLKVIGPHLQISDIPKTYADHPTVIEKHSRFWNGVPNMATWNGVGFQFGVHSIDTTFAMRRRDQRFGRLQRPSVRTSAPYAAVHIDWYYDSSSLPEDKVWYQNHSQPSVNHWR
jgi:hypothetical protein